MTRAEEIADEEVLLQVTTGGVLPSMAPHLEIAAGAAAEAANETQKEDPAECLEDWVDIEIEADEADMVDGWWEDEADYDDAVQDGEVDASSHMQIAARVGPTTVFASYLARLQAHFESMTREQSANIIHYLHDKLNKWRNEWVMALTSVSRDRADRLWALLVTYQGEPTCIQETDVNWAEERWKEVVKMLQIDAVRAADVEQFRLPRRGGPVKLVDTQVETTQAERASSSEDVLVRRTPEGGWERATEAEKEELAKHDSDLREAEQRQAQHDEHIWTSHQASQAREWDDWAIQSEMSGSIRLRPLKKFKVRVAVMDSDHNELATSDLTGEVEINDTPQVTFVVQEEVIQVPQEDDREREEEGTKEKTRASAGAEMEAQNEGKKGEKHDAEGDDDDQEDQADTIAVDSRDEDMDEVVDRDITDLGAIMNSVMGRQWFQLFMDGQVDENMVAKRWEAAALEVFQVNRDMMQMMEERVDDEKSEAESRPRRRLESQGLRVRELEGDSSSQSSGAKEFPKREVVAGRREREVDQEDNDCREEEEGQMEGREGTERDINTEKMEDAAGSKESELREEDNQQILEDTQLEAMDIEEGNGTEAAVAAPSTGVVTAGDPTATVTTSSSEGLRDGSYGEGKIQSNLEGCLH